MLTSAQIQQITDDFDTNLQAFAIDIMKKHNIPFNFDNDFNAVPDEEDLPVINIFVTPLPEKSGKKKKPKKSYVPIKIDALYTWERTMDIQKLRKKEEMLIKREGRNYCPIFSKLSSIWLERIKPSDSVIYHSRLTNWSRTLFAKISSYYLEMDSSLKLAILPFQAYIKDSDSPETFYVSKLPRFNDLLFFSNDAKNIHNDYIQKYANFIEDIVMKNTFFNR